ncbi:LacI family DNA-binding transcriptional regulator [Streptomyces sp. PSKA54]|uniref:LacI family DNA-binding transcriptional regulator n=1 Tax=Streptomyces himalayensis subsp. aureolus TaxID=2758039 RepID=A0A7W2D8P0_9ACTN|nr:LacI family DNA-binding transcriptional regulator [Streptomyces himalayensis]MBA4866678.1 LacI family DNA-binding transcriptional regulator [Streptomyces himalayensis subsp. aureolus]
MATIVDVAQLAGVSISTVSHVMNGTRPVADRTRERVLKAIAQTGYRRDTLARSLRRSRTDSIGLVVSDAGQPTFADMVRGVEHEAAKAGYTLLLAHSGEDPAQERRSVQALAARRVDGLIVAPAARSTGGETDAVRRSGTPVVILDRLGNGGSGDQVGVDNTKPMRELVEHLLGHGYGSIALAAGDLAVSTMAERHRGYSQALRAAGLEADSELVITGSGLAADTRVSAFNLFTGERRPEAVACASTETAVGVMEAAAEIGLRIPHDLKLAVFDGFPQSDLFEPRITTVVQPAFDIGATAMSLLLRRVNGDNFDEGEVIRLQPRVIYRTSCGCGTR